MAKAGFLLFLALMLAGFVAAMTLLIRPITNVGARKKLFNLTVFGTLMPYAIHGLQVYESLTTVSSGAGLAIGAYPVLDRWIALLLFSIGLLALAVSRISRARPFASAAIPLVMGIAYLFGFLPYAFANRGAGTFPTALPTSWLWCAMLAGAALIAAAARRQSRLADVATSSVSESA